MARSYFEDYDIDCGHVNPEPGVWSLSVHCSKCEHQWRWEATCVVYPELYLVQKFDANTPNRGVQLHTPALYATKGEAEKTCDDLHDLSKGAVTAWFTKVQVSKP
jgi:hypothetical protein